MHTPLLVIVLGISAATLWGFSDFLCAKSAKSMSPVLAASLVNTVGALAFAVVYGLFLRRHSNVDWIGFGYAATSGIFLALGQAFFFIGLEAGPVSIVDPLTSMYPLATTLLAVLLFHAHISFAAMVGVLLVVVGTIAASDLLPTQKAKRRGLTRGPTFALLSALAWGVGFALLGQAIRRMDWQSVSLIQLSFVAVSLLAALPFIGGREPLTRETIARRVKSTFVVGAGIFQLAGVMALNIGMARSAASGGAIVTAISACYPILTVFLAVKHFRERVRVMRLLGALGGVLGVVVLALSGVRATATFALIAGVLVVVPLGAVLVGKYLGPMQIAAPLIGDNGDAPDT
jgi:drug/metabolite transporter (DMT)-like permease